jgi:5-methylcytosine-specific restriction protein B
MPDGAAKSFLDSPGKSVKVMEPAPPGYAEGFLALAKRVRQEMHTLDLPIHATAESNPAHAKFESCKSTISALFELMRARHQEFGYRTMNEILRYLAVDYQLCKEKEQWDWAKALDTQVLQKVLPKLHGSKRKMGVFISELEKFCCTDGNPSKADLERSRNKLSEMIETVNRDQFVSSIQ